MQPGPDQDVRVVLVETSHPGNIGAVARAMKTMCLDSLWLVRPKRFPCAEATARAAGADDILYNARVVDTLADAVAGCVWVAGSSARPRSIEWPELSPRECGAEAGRRAREGSVALVFGREHSGLTNEELDLCTAVVRIPANPRYSSLNLAAAVQILAYEVLMGAVGSGDAPDAQARESVTAEQMEGLFGHLEEALVEIGYFDPERPKRLMRRLRRLFQRAGIDASELNILRGILRAAQQAARRGS